MSVLKDSAGNGPNREKAWSDADLLIRLIFNQADYYSFGEEREAFMCKLQSVVNNYAKEDSPSDAEMWLADFYDRAVPKG